MMVKIEKNIVIAMVLVLLVSGVYILYTSTTVNGTEILTPPVWEDEIPETIVGQLGRSINYNSWDSDHWYYSGVVPNTNNTVGLVTKVFTSSYKAASIGVYVYLDSELVFRFHYIDSVSKYDLDHYRATAKFRVVEITKQEIFLERLSIRRGE